MPAAPERQAQTSDHNVPGGLRRGACPTLAAPMPTGDGLLARLRPTGGALTVAQLRLLAVSAQANGNGIIEITTRGNLQVRGLRAETVELLASDIDAAGMVVPPNPAIELSPLHGLDPTELGNPADLERLLRDRLAPKLASPLLAPKLAILIDGRGRVCLDHLSADIRIVAFEGHSWEVSIGVTAQGARQVFRGNSAETVEAVDRVLDLLLAAGKHGRARDLNCEALDTVFFEPVQPRAPSQSARLRPGILMLTPDAAVLGLRPQFGQMRSDELLAFLSNLADDVQIRLAPDRLLLLTALTAVEAERLEITGRRHGLSADPRDPSANISACAGAGACMSGFYQTRALAGRIIARAPKLLDGSLTIHLSGCTKGCAHPAKALTISGSADGYRFCVDGKAGDLPDATIAGGGIESAIEKLAQLAGPQRQAGESAAACLKRLGAATIAKALRQD